VFPEKQKCHCKIIHSSLRSESKKHLHMWQNIVKLYWIFLIMYLYYNLNFSLYYKLCFNSTSRKKKYSDYDFCVTTTTLKWVTDLKGVGWRFILNL